MAFVTPVVEHWLEREIAQWVHPMKDRSDDPLHHERMLLPRSYISLLEISMYLLPAWFSISLHMNNDISVVLMQGGIYMMNIFNSRTTFLTY